MNSAILKHNISNKRAGGAERRLKRLIAWQSHQLWLLQTIDEPAGCGPDALVPPARQEHEKPSAVMAGVREDPWCLPPAALAVEDLNGSVQEMRCVDRTAFFRALRSRAAHLYRAWCCQSGDSQWYIWPSQWASRSPEWTSSAAGGRRAEPIRCDQPRSLLFKLNDNSGGLSPGPRLAVKFAQLAPGQNPLYSLYEQNLSSNVHYCQIHRFHKPQHRLDWYFIKVFLNSKKQQNIQLAASSGWLMLLLKLQIVSE